MKIIKIREDKELALPFILDIYTMSEEDREAGIISIEVYGNILGEMKYCYTGFVLTDQTLYDNGGYEEMIELLKDSEGKQIRVRFKYKNNKLKDFEILLDTLAEIYKDERFLKMERVGWGINEKSCRE